VIGRVLEKYEILEEVGQGGMSVVYRGLDRSLSRVVAVKVLHPHLAAIPEAKSRLEREAKAVAKLRHDNILEIYDYSGSQSADSYIVTEFIKGRTLREFIERHPIGFPEIAAMIACEVAGALAHAHGLGVIHRDVKPENLMIREDGVLKLMDFGIAQVVDTRRMTVTGQILGSPAYMAPEHVEGRPLDYRSDVFGLGVVLYQLATGELPFKGKNAHEILKRIADGKYLDPRVASIQVGNRLGAIIDRALARDPEERYPDMKRFEEELHGYLAEAGIEDPRRELKRFFVEREAYEKAFRPRLIGALTKRGHEARAARKHARALELWNRVLTLEPDHAEVLAAIDQLDRRRRWSKLVGVLAGVVVVGGASSAVVWMATRAGPGGDDGPSLAVSGPGTGASGGDLPDSPSPSASPSASALLAVPDSGSALVFVVDAARPKASASPSPTREPRPSPSASVAALRRVEIVPAPQAVNVFLDNKDLGGWGPQNRVLELSPGAHRIRLTNEACYDAVYDIKADEDPGRVALRLKWKPATLTVDSEGGTDIEVDGRPGRPGEPITVPIPTKSEDGFTEVHVKVSAAGRETRETKVKLRAAQPSTVRVDLPAS